MMEHQVLTMTKSSSTTLSVTAGHWQEQCLRQGGTMQLWYFPPLKISAAHKS